MEKLSHDQDHKSSQRQIVEMLAGANNVTNMPDEGNDYAVEYLSLSSGSTFYQRLCSGIEQREMTQ